MTNELKAKHTPGPWHVLADGSCVVDEHEESVITRPYALIIAAAPDLLDALKHALGDVKARLYVMPADVTDIERAILNAQIVRYESAIMKAEGR